METLDGGCHCGAVRFQVAVAERRALECNCSMCTKKALLHLIVSKERFTLRSGAERLSEYTFGTHTAKHLFCSTCGIHAFYVPRSHPDGYSVNVRCLDEVALGGLGAWIVEPFDGRRWEESIERIR